jgi:hypothetical protein
VIVGRTAAGVVGVAGVLEFPLSPPPQPENAKEIMTAHQAKEMCFKKGELVCLGIANSSFDGMVQS